MRYNIARFDKLSVFFRLETKLLFFMRKRHIKRFEKAYFFRTFHYFRLVGKDEQVEGQNSTEQRKKRNKPEHPVESPSPEYPGLQGQV